MRNAFVRAVQEIAEQDRRVVFLTGDLGFTVLEPLAERLGRRFINVGVSEQNMIGLATGLAEAGLVPFVYSIGTFASMRPYEFIRNGPLLHSLPVRIVGVGAGLDYGHNGVTHYSLEDVAVMRAQPDMTIIAPADPDQAVAAVHASRAIEGPIYFRIGKTNTTIAELNGRFELGRLGLVGEGRDVAIIALGSVADEAVKARELLGRQGIDATVAVVASVQPAPIDDLLRLLEDRPFALTVEAHYRTGGLGSLVAEVIAEHGLGCRLRRRAVEAMPRGLTGTSPFLHDAHRLSARSLAATIADEMAPLRQALSATP
ncbi:MAG TPA: transketolase C-terminal domain-containing protein [Solirubrobacteraceae bacterium]|nr:transketolase C-terminal domain-containing protein [Solirubrobacteraceae bacterium]